VLVGTVRGTVSRAPGESNGSAGMSIMGAGILAGLSTSGYGSVRGVSIEGNTRSGTARVESGNADGAAGESVRRGPIVVVGASAGNADGKVDGNSIRLTGAGLGWA
jgi:hypothetical protein